MHSTVIDLDQSFDLIIVGAGASGCVMAGRLSEDSNRKVLLIEAGADMPPGQEPAIVRDTYPRSYGETGFMWPAMRAQAHAGTSDEPGPERFYEQARLMGGGSSIMGMVALRGLPSDFAEWQRQGLARWGWEDVLPYYRKLERDLDFGASPLHGDQGPLPVRRYGKEAWPPFCAGIGRLLQARGHRLIDDMNTQFDDGVSSLPMSSLPTQRVSASMAYLDARVRARPNLHILTDVEVSRLWCGQASVLGVEVRVDGRGRRISAGETVVCAGAVNTPALLLRSGIGPAADLERLGLTVRASLGGVGRNLQNHPMASVAGWLRPRARQPQALRAWPQNALRFSSGVAGVPAGDMFMPILNKTSWHALGSRIAALGVSAYTTYSRGDVSLASADPAVSPRVRFNLLSDVRDLDRMASAFQMAVCLMLEARREGWVDQVFVPTAGPLLRRLNRPRVSSRVQARALATVMDTIAGVRRRALARGGFDPSACVVEDALARTLVKRFSVPAGHVCGTCRMGPEDSSEAVTDEQGRVHGVHGLRVADASLMPTLVAANTNLTVTMMAEKISDAMRSTR